MCKNKNKSANQSVGLISINMINFLKIAFLRNAEYIVNMVSTQIKLHRVFYRFTLNNFFCLLLPN